MTEEQAGYTTRKYHDPLDDVLDRPIAFNPAFRKITGSTNAALLLSQAFYWSKRTKDPEGWFYKKRTEWMEETGLTEDELDEARKKCRGIGVIEEKLKGVPAILYYRVNKAKVYQKLGLQIPTLPESCFPGNCQIPTLQESDKPANFNKESETTPEITPETTEHAADAAFTEGLDWKIVHGRPISQADLDAQKDAEYKNCAQAIAAGLGVNSTPGYELALAFMRARKMVIPHAPVANGLFGNSR